MAFRAVVTVRAGVTVTGVVTVTNIGAAFTVVLAGIHKCRRQRSLVSIARRSSRFLQSTTAVG